MMTLNLILEYAILKMKSDRQGTNMEWNEPAVDLTGNDKDTYYKVTPMC